MGKLNKSSPEYQLKLALIYERPMFDCPITGKVLDVNKSVVIRIFKGEKYQDIIIHKDGLQTALDKQRGPYRVEVIEDKDLLNKI